MNEYSIRQGANVRGSNGEKIGTVGDIFSGYPIPAEEGDTPAEGGDVGADIAARTDPENVDQTELEDMTIRPAAYQQSGAGISRVGTEQGSGLAPFTDADPDQPGGSVAFGPSDTKYFEVHHGGLLGIGGDMLYVPMSAVDVIDPEGNITLRVGADEARRVYAHEPQRM